MMPIEVNGVENFIMHGEGIRKWFNNDGGKLGDIYDGEYREGQAMGNGKFTYANGDIYEGQFENDRANGYGVFTK